MRATAQLWLLPGRQMPLLAAAAHVLWLAALACLLLIHPARTGAATGAGLIAAGSWCWHLALALGLRGVCQPESFLLPAFRRRLAGLAVADAVVWVAIPALLALACGAARVDLGAGLLLLAASMGFAMGVERWVSLMFWPLLILAGWKPALVGEVLAGALASPLTLLLLLLVCALLLEVALRPMLQRDDRPVQSTPLDGLSFGRAGAFDATQRRSALARRVETWFDLIAQHAMEHALARYRLGPTATRRLVLVRRLLLPHDNPAAIALRVMLMAVVAAIYVLAALHRQHFNAAAVGAYAVVIALARFPQIGRGMLRMRPNLADLYLTLAPATRADYQRTLADALLVLVPIGTLTALAYTGLGILLTHAAQPQRLLLVTLIVASSGGLVALSVHLIGPQNTLGRRVTNALVVAGAMATYWAGVWLVGALGYLIGGGLLALLTLGFGLGVWFAAQREYQQRTPCFEAPLA